MTDRAQSPRTHRERLAVESAPLDEARRPASGPIAVLPAGHEHGHGAVIEAAGGTVAPLGPDTRGVVYVAPRDVDTLVDTLESYPDISWVQLPFAGIDNFAKRLRPFAERGVLFTSAKGSYAQPVAEHALALTLATLRQLPLRARATAWGPSSGLSLYGAHVLILGAGGIALEYLDQLRPFDVSVTVGRRHADTPVPGADRTVDTPGFLAALPDADVVLLAAASTDETRGLLGAGEFAAMKPTAVLVNIARGPLVDTAALVRALDDEQLWGAGLDVTDPEPLPDGHALFSHPRAIVTPHTADTPEMVRPLFLTRVAANVEAFVDTGRFVGVADPIAGY